MAHSEKTKESRIPGQSQTIARWEWVALAVGTLVAGVIRFWNLGDVPPGLWYDEAINGLDALSIVREPGLPLFFTTEGHPREPLYIYLELIGVWLGGINAWSIRAVSAFIGTATVPAVWWMARRLGGPQLALLTLLIFVPMRWHVHFSRLAFRTILTPFLCALIVGFISRWFEHRKTRDAAIVGALLGLSLYTYLSMRLFLIAMVVTVPIAILLSFKGVISAQEIKRGTVASVLAFGLLVLPMLVDMARNTEQYFGRQQEISLIGQRDFARIAEQARDVALMGILRGDHVAKHNIPGPPSWVQLAGWGATNGVDSSALWIEERRDETPLDQHGTGLPAFDFLTGLLFYLGLVLFAVDAFRNRSWVGVCLLAWLMFGALASILSFGAPNMLRLLLLSPLAAVCIAKALLVLGGVLSSKGAPRPMLIGLLSVYFVFFSTGELNKYFHHWPQHPQTWREFNTNMTDVSRFLVDASARPEVVIVPDVLANHPTFAFEVDGIPGIVSHTESVREAQGRAWLLNSRIMEWRPENLSEGTRELGSVATFAFPDWDHPMISDAGFVWAEMIEIELP